MHRQSSWCLHLAGLAAYVVLGSLDRLVFAQMVLGMPTGVLLMHTQLALMSLSLFIVLQLARSQGAGYRSLAVSEVLQRLNALDVLSIAVLDTMHSLLALEGATAISGVTQVLIMQASVPATSILAALLLPPSVASSSLGASPKAACSSLRFRILHMVNHLTPCECIGRAATSHATYSALGAALIAGAVLAAVRCDSASPPASSAFVSWIGSHRPRAHAHVHMHVHIAQTSVNAASSPGFHVSGRALPAATGRLLFALSMVIAALANVHKRRCLDRQPTDQLLLNTCLAALQLFAGLFLAPPMMLLLRQQPIRDSLVQLARGLRCCMSGFNSVVCGEASDAFGVRCQPTGLAECLPGCPAWCCIHEDLDADRRLLATVLADAGAAYLLYCIHRMERGFVRPTSRRWRGTACAWQRTHSADDSPRVHSTGAASVLVGGCAA